MIRKTKWAKIGRVAFVSIGVVLLAEGVQQTISKWPFGQNYWGGLLYGPISIALAALILYISVFRWSKAKELMNTSRSTTKKMKSKRYPTTDSNNQGVQRMPDDIAPS